MKRILVPIDFSTQAINAAKTAALIAKKTDSDIYLLHMLELPVDVIDPTGLGATNGPGIVHHMKRVQEKFDDFLKSPFFEGLNVVEAVQFAKTFTGIIEGCKKNDIDLIVMGSKGATGLTEMIIGSNTEKVVRRSNVPVLVIKEEQNNINFDNVVFASDFSDENKTAFPKLLDFAKFFDSKIHLLKVNTVHNFETTKATTEKIQEFTQDFNLKNHSINIYNDISIEQGILNFSKSIDADLIALNTHGRSGLSHLFNGSIGEDLANHALRPVITFKI